MSGMSHVWIPPDHHWTNRRRSYERQLDKQILYQKPKPTHKRRRRAHTLSPPTPILPPHNGTSPSTPNGKRKKKSQLGLSRIFWNLLEPGGGGGAAAAAAANAGGGDQEEEEEEGAVDVGWGSDGEVEA